MDYLPDFDIHKGAFMPGKVFISCGQANPKEKEVAKKLEDWLRTEGFSPYVAIRTQSINDVNSGIIGNLKNSDYYIFIDFRREKISCFKKIYRGSLFTNQELAIAYYLGFDNAIFFQQTGVKRDGLLNYMISNSTLFNDQSKSCQLYLTWSYNFNRLQAFKGLK